MDSPDSGWGPKANFCDNGDEIFRSMTTWTQQRAPLWIYIQRRQQNAVIVEEEIAKTWKILREERPNKCIEKNQSKEDQI